MKNTLFKRGSAVALALGVSAFFASCGGGGGGGGNTASSVGGTTGTGSGGSGGTPIIQTTLPIGVYIQDSPSVPAGIGIYGISIANTNDGDSCSLFSQSPAYFFNLANLNQTAEFLGTYYCLPDNYNQISITFYPAVSYINPANGYSNTMVSLSTIPIYYTGGSANISCSSLPGSTGLSSSTCVLTLTSNTSFSIGTNSPYIDFDFGFNVDNSGNFSLTVNPINGAGVQPNEPVEFNGIISNVSNSSFTLQDNLGDLVTVNYSGFPQLLNLLNSITSSAVGFELPPPVSVVCSNLILNQQAGTVTCNASTIRESIEGAFVGYNNATNSVTLNVLSFNLLTQTTQTTPIGIFNLPNYFGGPVSLPAFSPTAIYPPTMSFNTFESDANNSLYDWLYLVDSCNITSQTCTTTIYYVGQS